MLGNKTKVHHRKSLLLLSVGEMTTTQYDKYMWGLIQVTTPN